jgi:hypothetical protein
MMFYDFFDASCSIYVMFYNIFYDIRIVYFCCSMMYFVMFT